MPVLAAIAIVFVLILVFWPRNNSRETQAEKQDHKCAKCHRSFAKEDYITWPSKFDGLLVDDDFFLEGEENRYRGMLLCHVCWNQLSIRHDARVRDKYPGWRNRHDRQRLLKGTM